MIERDLQALEDVRARLGLAQLELVRRRTTSRRNSTKFSMISISGSTFGRPRDDRQHDDPERRLQLRVLVEIVQDDLGNFAAPQLDDDPHAVAIGLVAKIGDAFDRLVVAPARRSSRAASPC